MRLLQLNPVFFIFMLLIAAICIAQPVLAVNGTVTISYRGSGLSYIGDTVIFDGKNTAGNTTVITITGPGLPREGVPVYNLNGMPGTGYKVAVNTDGSWRFAWYTSNIQGVERMQTARYFFTAADLFHPEKSGTTSVLMKKPLFFLIPTPSPAHPGDYVTLYGNAENGILFVRIDVTDTAGTTLRTFTSPVSASGDFNYGFHADMPPGQYYITASNPSMKNTFRMVFFIVPPQVTPTGTGSPPVQETPAAAAPLPQPSAGPALSSSAAVSLSAGSTPSGADVYIDSVLRGKTPLVVGDLTEGIHLVEIKTPGYLFYSASVPMKNGEPVILSPVLQKSPAPIPLSPFTIIIGLLISSVIVLASLPGYRKSP